MRFWEIKKLSEMTSEEWESLCDNCGKCCLHKLEDEDTGDIYYTSIACNLIDLDTGLCTCYAERSQLVPECLNLKQGDFVEYSWLPATCAYRLLSEWKELSMWHPLLSGNPASTQEAGVSIISYAMKESEVNDPEEHIIEWLR